MMILFADRLFLNSPPCMKCAEGCFAL